MSVSRKQNFSEFCFQIFTWLLYVCGDRWEQQSNEVFTYNEGEFMKPRINEVSVKLGTFGFELYITHSGVNLG